jgi:hypothetical protein
MDMETLAIRGDFMSAMKTVNDLAVFIESGELETVKMEAKNDYWLIKIPASQINAFRNKIRGSCYR